MSMRKSIIATIGIILLWSVIFTSIFLLYKIYFIQNETKFTNYNYLNDKYINRLSIINTSIINETQDSNDIKLNHYKSNHKYAYVTLLHGIDNTYLYRGFLYNCLIIKKSLVSLNSQADFIVLIGFTYGDNPNNEYINNDLKLLESHGVILYYLNRLLTYDQYSIKSKDNNISLKNKSKKSKILFSEMALLKITPFKFIQYEKIQYIDADVLPISNMDCYFKLSINTFNTGNASPLNSGWYLILPNMKDYELLKKKAIWRLQHRWNDIIGWNDTIIPLNYLYYRSGQKQVVKWNFNGASLDQGLMTNYFVFNEGRVQLIDIKEVHVYTKSIDNLKKNHPLPNRSIVKLEDALECCKDKSDTTTTSTSSDLAPINRFYHYTGRSKPWLQLNPSHTQDTMRKSIDTISSLKLWYDYLDMLQLDLNSSNIHKYSLKSPLGYFYPNK